MVIVTGIDEQIVWSDNVYVFVGLAFTVTLTVLFNVVVHETGEIFNAFTLIVVEDVSAPVVKVIVPPFPKTDVPVCDAPLYKE